MQKKSGSLERWQEVERRLQLHEPVPAAVRTVAGSAATALAKQPKGKGSEGARERCKVEAGHGGSPSTDTPPFFFKRQVVRFSEPLSSLVMLESGGAALRKWAVDIPIAHSAGLQQFSHEV